MMRKLSRKMRLGRDDEGVELTTPRVLMAERNENPCDDDFPPPPPPYEPYMEKPVVRQAEGQHMFMLQNFVVKHLNI